MEMICSIYLFIIVPLEPRSQAILSPLHYDALELLGMPSLTLNEEQRKSLGIPRKFCVRMGTDRIWQEHLLPSFMIEYKKGQHGTCM